MFPVCGLLSPFFLLKYIILSTRLLYCIRYHQILEIRFYFAIAKACSNYEKYNWRITEKSTVLQPFPQSLLVFMIREKSARDNGWLVCSTSSQFFLLSFLCQVKFDRQVELRWRLKMIWLHQKYLWRWISKLS